MSRPTSACRPAQPSASFTATTFSGTGNTTAQLVATLGETTLFAALGVTQSQSTSLTALSVSPTAVSGGSSSTGTVTLSAPAPAGGAIVTLSDNSAAASVPGSVTVSAGASSRTFTVTTSAVSSQTAVTISGSFGGVTRNATLTVNPASPSAPSLQSPANLATGVAQPVAFNWTDVTGAVDYEIQVDNTSTISAPFIANQIVNVSQASIGALPAEQLWWRVRARNAAGVLARSRPRDGSRLLRRRPRRPVRRRGLTDERRRRCVRPPAPSPCRPLRPPAAPHVALTSANSAVTVPASVTRRRRGDERNVRGDHHVGRRRHSGDADGDLGASLAPTTLTVNPPASLTGVALAPTSLVGGAPSAGTVTLSSSGPGREDWSCP